MTDQDAYIATLVRTYRVENIRIQGLNDGERPVAVVTFDLSAPIEDAASEEQKS